jgi:hypothetical protein
MTDHAELKPNHCEDHAPPTRVVAEDRRAAEALNKLARAG